MANTKWALLASLLMAACRASEKGVEPPAPRKEEPGCRRVWDASVGDSATICPDPEPPRPPKTVLVKMKRRLKDGA